MAYSIGGVPIILDSGSVSVSAGQSITAPELYVIKGGEALGVATASAAGDIVAPSVETESFTLSGTTTTAIVTSGINTVAPTGDIVTENAVAQAIIPLIGSVNDALNPTDADFSSTDLTVQSLTANTGDIVATAGQFTGDGQGLTGLQASEVTGALADANVAETNVTQHQAALAIAGTQLTGTAADAFITETAVTQHEAALSIDASTQLTGELQSAQFPTALPAIDGSAVTNLQSSALEGSLPALDGSALTVLSAASLTGAMPAIDGSALTSISAENANTVALADDSASVGSYPLTFAASSDSNQALLTNSAVVIDPSTGEITLTQELQANGGVNQTSDSRFKENVKEIEGGLEKLNSIRGVTFDWKENSGLEGPSVGLIAQELLAVVPEAVNTENEEKYSVNYNGAIALLISAVKELSAKVEALENN
jgi:hypothetical protein